MVSRMRTGIASQLGALVAALVVAQPSSAMLMKLTDYGDCTQCRAVPAADRGVDFYNEGE